MFFGLTTEELGTNMLEWFNVTGWKVLIVVVVIYIGHKFGNLFITRAVRRSIRRSPHQSKAEELQREDTILGITTTAFGVLLWVLGGMTILSILGVNVAALIASAGLASVAIGFGAQNLIKDFVAGLYVIMENHYRVGDVVSLDGTSGVVKRISLRETVLRDLDGNVHHISNGSVTVATNMTFEYSQVNLDVGVSYNTDLDKLETVINKVCADLTKDEEWTGLIVETPSFLRIEELGDSAVVAKIVGKTKPMQQWAVAGELRKRLKKSFDKEGIEIPFPQMVIHQPTLPKKRP